MTCLTEKEKGATDKLRAGNGKRRVKHIDNIICLYLLLLD